MDTQAVLKYQRISAQKCRLVANSIRGLKVDKALEFLEFNNKKASQMILKVLESAIANAENNNNSDIDKLSIKTVIVNQGMRLKRMKARARGRADRIIKPTCHIEIVLTEVEK